MTHEDESGGISPSGRFARMEASLERIEQKLDAKADHVDLQGLSIRMADLETADIIRNATVQAQKEIADSRYRLMLAVVAFLTIINVSLGIVVSIGALFPRGVF